MWGRKNDESGYQKHAVERRGREPMNQAADPSPALLGQIRFVLVEPSHPGNIGAAARAMKVMGLSRLVLLAPERYPSVEATAMASGAADLLAAAPIVHTLDEALAGCRLILGTSARQRSLAWPSMAVRDAAAKAVAEAAFGDIAVLFGRERVGLDNHELARCHLRVEIPTQPDFSSLNLAQAVQVAAYEFRLAALAAAGVPAVIPDAEEARKAGDEEMEMLFAHLEKTLADLGFLDPDHPRRLLLRLRRMLLRARPDLNEYNILRGILSAMDEVLTGAEGP